MRCRCRRRGGHLVVAHDRDHQCRPRSTGRRGCSRESSTSICRTGWRHAVCILLPIRAASRRARSAATSPTTRVVRTAWPRASPTPTSSLSRWCCPTGRSPCWAGRTRSRRATTCGGCSWAARGMLGIATEVCVRLTQNYPDVRTMLMDFDDVEDGASVVSGIIAAGMVPAAIEMMDRLCLEAVEAYIHADLPVDSGGGTAGGDRRSAARARGAGAARRRDRRAVPRQRRPCGSRRGRTSVALEGAQVGVRCDRQHPARLLPARHGRAALRAARGAGDDLRHRRAARAPGTQRLPCRRRQPPPAARVRRAGARHGRTGARGRPRDRRGVGRGRRGAERRARDRLGETRLHAPHVLRGRSGRPERPALWRSIRRCCRIPARCCPIRRRAARSTGSRSPTGHGCERRRARPHRVRGGDRVGRPGHRRGARDAWRTGRRSPPGDGPRWHRELHPRRDDGAVRRRHADGGARRGPRSLWPDPLDPADRHRRWRTRRRRVGLAATRVRPGPGRPAPGSLRERGRRGREGGWPHGQERERLRPVPAAGGVAGARSAFSAR